MAQFHEQGRVRIDQNRLHALDQHFLARRLMLAGAGTAVALTVIAATLNPWDNKESSSHIPNTTAVGAKKPNDIPLQLMEIPPKEVWKPSRYYSGDTIISLSNELNFRGGAMVYPGNQIPDNKNIVGVKDQDTENAVAIKIKNAQTTRNEKGEEWVIVPDVTIYMGRDERGTRQYVKKTVYVFAGQATMGLGLVRFSGGEFADIKDLGNQRVMPNNGSDFGAVSLVYPQKP